MVQKRAESWLFKKGKRWARLSDFDEMFVHYVRRVHSLYLGLFLVGTTLKKYYLEVNAQRRCPKDHGLGERGGGNTYE